MTEKYVIIYRGWYLLRLDKYLADSGKYSRSDAGKMIRGGIVSVNGKTEKNPSAKVEENFEIRINGVPLGYKRFTYIMLNKPAGTVSTTDNMEKSVMKLLPDEYTKMEMFPCGRLDIDTVGLLLITNDGQTAHSLLSPKKHCEKTYRFECLPIGENEVRQLEKGINLSDFTSKPCEVIMSDNTHGEITVTEGKYHQIKRMFHAVGSEITYLERIKFAGIPLDPSLERGDWRMLSDEEEKQLLSLT